MRYFVQIGTGSRGDVFVVRTSKPVENLWKNGLFWSSCPSRYSFVTHSIDCKSRDWGLARSAYSIKYKIDPFFYSALRASVALRSPFGRCAVRQQGYSLLRRRFQGSSYYVPPHKRLLNQDNIPFPSLANHVVLSKFRKADLDRTVTW